MLAAGDDTVCFNIPSEGKNQYPTADELSKPLMIFVYSFSLFLLQGRCIRHGITQRQMYCCKDRCYSEQSCERFPCYDKGL